MCWRTRVSRKVPQHVNTFFDDDTFTRHMEFFHYLAFLRHILLEYTNHRHCHKSEDSFLSDHFQFEQIMIKSTFAIDLIIWLEKCK